MMKPAENNEGVEVQEEAPSGYNMGQFSSATEPTKAGIPVVGFIRQLWFATRKNWLLMLRKPLYSAVMIFSSLLTVCLAWPTVKDSNKADFSEVPLTQCGGIPYEWSYWLSRNEYGSYLPYDEVPDYPLSYNDSWKDGFSVTIMAFGPFIFAVCVYLIVEDEIQSQMLGQLRALGLRESVYWISWWNIFLLLAFINSLLGALAAVIIESVHAFQHIDFGPIFVSFFALNFSLIGASFFFAAIGGTLRITSALFILTMVAAEFIPYIVLGANTMTVDTPNSQASYYNNPNPTGLFWTNINTTVGEIDFYGCYIYDPIEDRNNSVPCNFTTCERATVWEEERADIFVTSNDPFRLEFDENELFTGCYFGAGWSSYVYSANGAGGLKAFLPFFPYTQFLMMWGNFLGYTGMPNRQFSFEKMSMTSEELADASLGPRGSDLGDTLFPQGSTLLFEQKYNYYDYDTNTNYFNCPYANVSDTFCDYIGPCNGAYESDSISSNAMLGILIALGIFYNILAWYWVQVFPGGNGSPRKFYFPFLPSYWIGGIAAKRNVVSDGEIGVSTDTVSKNYGENHAVDRVSVNLASGQVTAMLGHNGAGKTTLSHILCCETLPSDGDASVFGLSVTHDPYIVRQMVGVCKQDDYLYPKLTAKEHLVLWAGLRGVKDSDLEEVVQEWLESVDLHEVQNGYSSGFSGGMKRRLSVALSTVGDRPFIILDEPTTGMDPVSRRFVWNHVDGIKDGRVVLLTTHAMEEADLLAENVVIMRKGNVAASGSPLELKSEIGSSLQFAMLIEVDQVDRVADAIRKQFRGQEDFVSVDAAESGNIAVSISKVTDDRTVNDGVTVNALVDFVSFMDSDSAIQEYGFSNASLEEVFLKVTEEEEAETEEEGGQDEEDAKGRCCRRREGCCARRRRKKAEAKAAKLEATKEGETDEELEVVDEAELHKEGGVNDIGSFEPNLTLLGQSRSYLLFLLRRDWLGKTSIASWVMHSLGVVAVVLAACAVASKNSSGPIGFNAFICFVASFTIMTIVTPLFYERSSGLFYLIRSQGMMSQSYILVNAMYSFVACFIFTFVLLSLYYATPYFRDPIPCEPYSTSPQPPFYTTESCDTGFGSPERIAGYEATQLSPWDDLYNNETVSVYALRTSAGYGQFLGIIVVFVIGMPGFVLASMHLPGFKMAATMLSILILCVSFLPMVLYFVINGRSAEDNMDCFVDICNNTFSDFDPRSPIDGETFLNCAGFEANSGEIGLACMPKASGLIPHFAMYTGLGLTWMGEIEIVTDPPEYAKEVLLPNLSGDYCDGATCEFPFAKDTYKSFMGFGVLGGVLLLLLGFLLVALFTFPVGMVLTVKNKLYAFFQCIVHPFRMGRNVTAEEEAKEDTPEVKEEQEIVRAQVESFTSSDEDSPIVHITDPIPRDEVPPLLAYKLRKEYETPRGVPNKVALKSLELHVPKGQVLGLLGKNGAGKTTALKIFAGAHDSTSGIALVGGYDIATEQLRVFERLGNCAQFDCIWPYESIQTHLEFFGGLKGFHPSQVCEIAQTVATAVGLGAPEVFKRRAGALSGGMRRRLSIAISLIGAPSVLLLDEPTTGLDPSTRNKIWDLVKSFATEKRSIVITTHMMIEADTLCNRIAIMAQGRLKTVGTQQWLKNTYGSGYLLQLNLVQSTQENQNRAMDFVRSKLHSEARLHSRQAKTLHVSLPRETSLATVFRVLYSDESKKAGINQFLFSQSSLEDVFITMGE